MNEDDEALKRLPSLATLCRYRARIERDRKDAEQSLQELQCSRPFDPALARVQEAKQSRPDPAGDTADRVDGFCGTDEPDSTPYFPQSPRHMLNCEERRRLEAMRRKPS